jgi:hypothetical protein
VVACFAKQRVDDSWPTAINVRKRRSPARELCEMPAYSELRNPFQRPAAARFSAGRKK